MRMTPVKSGTVARRAWVRFRLWEIRLRMWEQYGEADVWFPESYEPLPGSPWSETSTHELAEAQVGPLSVMSAVNAEAKLRVEAVQDYFAGLQALTRTRSVYSLHVLSRSVIEACAFASWLFDPEAEPVHRLLRGLMLRKEALAKSSKSLGALAKDAFEESDSDYRAQVVEARDDAAERISEIELVIERLRSDRQQAAVTQPGLPIQVPSTTKRVREMLCDEMQMPQGFDAYHRMSRVAHSEAIGIIGTWNANWKKPSIDYFDMLEFSHLALCSIDFTLERRAQCWGETRNSARLRKIIDRVERIIEGKPEVHLI